MGPLHCLSLCLRVRAPVSKRQAVVSPTPHQDWRPNHIEEEATDFSRPEIRPQQDRTRQMLNLFCNTGQNSRMRASI